MKVLSWNSGGLAHAPTIRALQAFIRTHRPDLIFLSETKVASARFQPSLLHLGFFAWLEIPPVGLKGGLFVTWKHGIEIEPVRLDRSCISCLVFSHPSHCPWLFSFIYAPHIAERRSVFWSELTNLGNSFSGAWLLLGDFNSVLSPSESGGRAFGSSSQNDFVDFIQSNALIDPGFVGNKFAWSEVEGSPAFSLSKKWKSTKSALKVWNQQHFGYIQSRIKSLMSEISLIQSNPHSPANAAREVVLQESLQEHLLREEVLWKQKSRELWLTCTDLNSKFFHASTACRRRYNSISSLKAYDGTRLCGRDNIGSFLVNHFSTLFSSTSPNFDDSLSELVVTIIYLN
ncbi:uncharacterized protein LOC132181913 [Corylus avellana]|uniref:uncharacterized protein LOC132181913 n=1 Tax=Corylus avellana TaxID=13451 RepID=UPI00286B7AD1|nr:uncharacterized protein LOC132181913 [Corylus avellana]